MISQVEILRSLYGAGRLAQLDPGGMQYFVRTSGGAWRSFAAALIVLPIYLLIESGSLGYQIARHGLVLALVMHALFFIIRWTIFPVVMITVLSTFGLPEKFVDFLVAYNWGNVIQLAIFLPFLILQWVAPQAGYLDMFYWATITAVLAYLWFVIRTATGLSHSVVAGLVILDFIIAMMVIFVSVAMLGLPPQT